MALVITHFGLIITHIRFGIENGTPVVDHNLCIIRSQSEGCVLNYFRARAGQRNGP
jgi:hypothetical protein